MALGARTQAVIGDVLKRATIPVFIGLGAGILGSLWIGKLVESHLFGVESRDPVTFVGTAVVIVVAAVIASLVPATRAASVDPSEVLRVE